jgi:hypothetical protein
VTRDVIERSVPSAARTRVGGGAVEGGVGELLLPPAAIAIASTAAPFAFDRLASRILRMIRESVARIGRVSTQTSCQSFFRAFVY